jgi:hypothetical protein
MRGRASHLASLLALLVGVLALGAITLGAITLGGGAPVSVAGDAPAFAEAARVVRDDVADLTVPSAILGNHDAAPRDQDVRRDAAGWITLLLTLLIAGELRLARERALTGPTTLVRSTQRPRAPPLVPLTVRS